jgi:hypothetical protein
MHPQLTLIAAQQHIADLHRAVDHNRLVHTATTATSSHVLTDTQDGDGGVALDGDEVAGNDRTTERPKWWWVGNGLR